jgi:hypothetical protein
MDAEKEELFPVYDATTFFTDMHQILKIIALGNVRTLCHHRLRFLEQVSYMGGTFGVIFHKPHHHKSFSILLIHEFF